MEQLLKNTNNNFKLETIIRVIIAVIGILTFNISTDFGWGFILGGIISKEGIDLKIKEGWGLLALITGIMLIAIYFLLEVPAVYGYITSTIFYFILRDSFTYFLRRKK